MVGAATEKARLAKTVRFRLASVGSLTAVVEMGREVRAVPGGTLVSTSILPSRIQLPVCK